MIYIIGGGPIGCYAAHLLGKKHNVRVFEEHEKIGQPIQCTGIFTNNILKYIPKKSKFIINKINNVEIYTPTKKKLVFLLKNQIF
jgi:digeranylgeranylglycerophospholipid reductase